MIKLNFDGGCLPKNPGGVGVYGYLLTRDNKKIACGAGIADKVIGSPMTNNIAEYTALIEGLKVAKDLLVQGEEISVKGDSQMVINMARKTWGWKKTKYLPHPDKSHLREMLEKVFAITEGLVCHYEWVPREQNTDCDRLAELAYIYQNDIPELRKVIHNMSLSEA